MSCSQIIMIEMMKQNIRDFVIQYSATAMQIMQKLIPTKREDRTEKCLARSHDLRTKYHEQQQRKVFYSENCSFGSSNVDKNSQFIKNHGFLSLISFILCSHPENQFSHLDAKEPCGCGPVFFFRTENARQLLLRFFQGLSVRLRKSYMLRNIII